MARMPIEERFWSKVNKSEGCWNWLGKPMSTGYGKFETCTNYVAKHYLAHRYIFTIMGIEIPEGKFVDHICHNKMCVKPDHLRFVTNKENHEHLLGPYSTTTSGVRGVSWNTERQKWRAQVYHHGKCHFLGLFGSVEDAANAAHLKRLELFTHNDLDRVA